MRGRSLTSVGHRVVRGGSLTSEGPGHGVMRGSNLTSASFCPLNPSHLPGVLGLLRRSHVVLIVAGVILGSIMGFVMGFSEELHMRCAERSV